jgi:hypothetical protein
VPGRDADARGLRIAAIAGEAADPLDRRLVYASVVRTASLLVLLGACTPSPASSSPPSPPPSPSATVAAPVAAASSAPAAPSATKGQRAPAGAVPKLSVATRGALLDVIYENSGTAPVSIYTHIATHEEQVDWLTVELTDAAGHARTIGFTDARDKSAPVSVELAPGQRVTVTLDVVAWAARGVNGGKPLAAGTYQLSAVYDSSREDRAWSGKLAARTVLVVK